MINPFGIGIGIGNPIEFDGVKSDRTKSVDFDRFTGTREAFERDVVIQRNLEVFGYGE
jgi:hypothetical protein